MNLLPSKDCALQTASGRIYTDARVWALMILAWWFLPSRVALAEVRPVAKWRIKACAVCGSRAHKLADCPEKPRREVL